MEDLLYDLISYAIEKNASDIHFICSKNDLKIQLRCQNQMLDMYQDIWKPSFFEYLKFISKMDLTNPFVPQSGQFKFNICGKDIFCRFSVIYNHQIQTGVLRLLNNSTLIGLEDLSLWHEDLDFFKSLLYLRQGLVISCGPTNSGKTTTLHALLHEIALLGKHKVVSLEDPIEIEDSNYLQLQINESMGFSYDVGIEQLLRHDPDVICIGETRNAYTAQMMVRAALTGHFVLTTLHAKNGLECLSRLMNLGINKIDLYNVITGVFSQRLYSSKNGKVCVYEILTQKDIQFMLDHQRYPDKVKTLQDKIREGIEKGYIQDEQAKYDLFDFS